MVFSFLCSLAILTRKMSANSSNNQARQSKNDGDYKTVLSMQDIASLLRYWATSVITHTG